METLQLMCGKLKTEQLGALVGAECEDRLAPPRWQLWFSLTRLTYQISETSLQIIHDHPINPRHLHDLKIMIYNYN